LVIISILAHKQYLHL